MKQLSGADHMWLTIEDDRTPMHVLSAAVCRESPRAPPVDVDRLTAYVTARLGELPLRRRLLFPPLKSDLAYWLEDPDFDVTQHIHEAPVAGGRHWSDALDTLRQLAESRLDRTKPLWQLYLLPRLDLDEDGDPDSFVILAKLHHAQFDGTSLMRLIDRFYSTSPTTPEPAVDIWQPDEAPGARDLVARAGVHALRRSARAVQLVASSTLRTARAALTLRGTPRRPRPTVARRPARTRFAASITSPARVFEAVEWPLGEVKAMRTSVEGATINDVALTIVAGALQRYLTEHREPIGGALVAWCPVVVDQPGRQDGNFVSVRPSDLYADEPDPLTRLERVRTGTARIKEVDKIAGFSEASASFLDIAPVHLAEPFDPVRRIAGRMIDNPLVPLSGLSVSNVPGSPDVLYLDGHEVTRFITCAFLADGMGLLIVISSYRGQFSVGFHSTPGLLPDPEYFMGCLRTAYDELRHATIGRSRPAVT